MAQWDKIIHRGNVEDRRGASGLALGGGGLSLVGVGLVFLLNLLGGGSASDLNDILGQLPQAPGIQQNVNPEEFQGEDDYERFASTVLGSSNAVWTDIFKQDNKTYDKPKLVLFRNGTQSGCGFASSQVGPHYCPYDETIYLDETFFDELKKRFGAEGGDVAEAYVISHEVGHHVQNELGIMDQVRRGDNEQSIKLELQADCFAGVWAHSVQSVGIFEPNEIREAIDAAEAVGDDRIQEKVQGQVNPESWTHGSSAQRAEWFNRGFSTGRSADCNTFQ